MSKFPLDLSKFKAKNLDEKCATLEHKDGHSITIALSALTPKMKEKLEKLFPAPQKMAKGGQVEERPLVIEEVKEEPLQIEPAPEIDVPAPLEVEPVDQIPEGAPGPGGPQMPIAQAPVEDPAVKAKQEAYAQAYNMWKQNNPGSPDEIAREQGYAAVQRLDNIKAQEAVVQQQEAAKQAAENQRRAQMGLPPLEGGVTIAEPMMRQINPMPQQQEGVQLGQPQQIEAQGATPEMATPPALDQKVEATPDMMHAYNSMLQGIHAEEAAQIGAARAQEKLYTEAAAQQQEQIRRYDEQVKVLDQERQAFIKDIRENRIDPNKYWENHSKVGTIIGIILAGFNPTSAPNAAIELLNKQMDAELQAQAKNLDNKQTLLSANLRQFGNLNDAMKMTQIMQADMMSNQLKAAAAKSTDPMAKARAMQAAAQLEMQVAPAVQKLAISRALEGLVQEANRNPNAVPTMLSAMRQVDPERAKDLEQKYVPGMGFALTPGGAAEVRKLKASVDSSVNGIKELQKLISKPGKSLSLSDRAKAEALQSTLIGALRVPIVGPGAMNESEQALLKSLIANPTKMFSLDSSNKVKLKTIEKKLIDHLNVTAQAEGVNIPDPMSRLSPQQQSFAKWARQNLNSENPENAKKARMVLEKLGIE